MVTPAPPDPGQLVDVRQRRFVVLDVRQSALPADELRGNGRAPQHLLTLSSVEDDGLGEELQVIWELEPGAQVFEKAALPEPTSFDEPRRLDAFLDAVRWGAMATADPGALHAPFYSGIQVEDYQLDPLVRALLMPRVNLLIADDVGLGKTIEAGLVAQELILRHRVRTVVVVCPASLQIKWQQEMRDRFGLEFRIVDSELMRELRRRRGIHVNPWTHFPRLITSIDFLKRERPMRLMREALPAEGEPAFPRRFDLLIVDEAHNIAPPGAGRYAVESYRTRAIRALTPHFEHRLFLTATPHNGYPESFQALLEMLDNQRFARSVRPDREQLGAVMVRRLKSELPPRWDGTPRFPRRTIQPLEVDYPDDERRAQRWLKEYTRRRQRGPADAVEEYATEFVLKLLKKRLFSSPAAFAATLEQHERSVRTARRRAGMPRPSVGMLRRQVEGAEEEFAEDDSYDSATAEAVDAASRLFRPPTPEEEGLLKEMREWAGTAAARADAKAEALIRWLHENLRPGGSWNDQRVLIFTEYRATQKWLQGLLAAEGLASAERLMTLYGGMRADDRERIKAAFQAHPDLSPVRILLATDAASEGIDLQNHCSRLIHYEIPWNPNRMEQRNGRIDRHGQRSPEVQIYHFVGRGYRATAPRSSAPGELEGDLEFLFRAALKVEQIREDLGKVGPVIAAQVEQAMLGRRTRLETEGAERESEPVRRMLRFERELRAQLQQFRERLRESQREMRLEPENVQAVVEVGLELAGQPPLREARVPGLWPLPGAAAGWKACATELPEHGTRTRCPVFRMPPLSGSWQYCLEGLLHPHTREPRPIVFDHALAEGRDDLVLAHLNHRLVQMCLRLLRGEIWSTEARKRLQRVTARLVRGHVLETPAVVAHARLVVLGGDNQRVHEEVITAGGFIREGRLTRMNVGQVRDSMEAVLPIAAAEGIRGRLVAIWPSIAGPLYRSLEARVEELSNGLRRTLEERERREVEGITAVLRELERGIRGELEAPVDAQLSLWSEMEREQLQRDRASLEAHLERIPAEIERETAAIRTRYSNTTARLFPAAVTFLVPEQMMHSP